MKVLIISSNALSKVGNNGKTYRSFLTTLPRENVANLYFGNNEIPDESTCANFYRVTEGDIIKSILKLKFKTSNSHVKLMQALRARQNTACSLPDSKVMQWLKSKAATLAPIRELLWDFNTWNTYALDEWIKNFAPNKIFAVLGNGAFNHKIARYLSYKYNIPLNVYFTDDYILNNTASNLFQSIQYSTIKREYKKTLDVADKAFVIGNKMKNAYEAFFKREFGILVNGIEITKFEKIRPREYSFDEPFVISYLGGLHLNRWKSIAKISRIANAIPEVRFEFRVFSIKQPSDEILAEFKKSNIHFCGSLNADEVLSEIENSHCLIHVESFDMQYRIYTRFSVSTKIPEYMASKRGIIAFGPSEIASIQIFNDNGIGCVFTEKDTEENIREKLYQFVSAYNSIDFNKQFEFAKSNFDQRLMALDKKL